jgi:hypothetical protein
MAQVCRIIGMANTGFERAASMSQSASSPAILARIEQCVTFPQCHAVDPVSQQEAMRYAALDEQAPGMGAASTEDR